MLDELLVSPPLSHAPSSHNSGTPLGSLAPFLPRGQITHYVLKEAKLPIDKLGLLPEEKKNYEHMPLPSEIHTFR